MIFFMFSLSEECLHGVCLMGYGNEEYADDGYFIPNLQHESVFVVFIDWANQDFLLLLITLSIIMNNC